MGASGRCPRPWTKNPPPFPPPMRSERMAGGGCFLRITQGGGSASAPLRRALPWAGMLLPLWGAALGRLGIGGSVRMRPVFILF